MKNYEKYVNKIKEYGGNNFCSMFVEPHILKSIGLSCGDLTCGACRVLQLVWLTEGGDPKEPEIDWSKVEVDTPVLVRDNENNEWRRFYFAKYENGLVYTWVAGATSWTAKGNMYKWRFAKLAESEDKCEKTNKEEPETDWSKVEVDTPILVRDSENTEWLKKHFAKYEDGIVYVWNLGRTSWTAPHDKSVSAWRYAKLIEDEKEHKEPEVDWSKVEVDTPILVRVFEGEKWKKRYFAKVENGFVYAWTGENTSLTAHGMTRWSYAKLAESEETK